MDFIVKNNNESLSCIAVLSAMTFHGMELKKLNENTNKNYYVKVKMKKIWLPFIHPISVFQF